MKFILEIELGNEAMRNVVQIAGALIDTSEYLLQHAEPALAYPRPIRDVNGNMVGSYRLAEPASQDILDAWKRVEEKRTEWDGAFASNNVPRITRLCAEYFAMKEAWIKDTLDILRK